MDGYTFLFNRGGRGTGKSVGTTREAIWEILLKRNHSLLVVRKDESTNRTSTYNEFLNQLDFLGLQEGSDYKATKNPLLIRLANGSEIVFKGMDKPKKLKSLMSTRPFGGVLFEEATEIDSWAAITTVTDSIRDVDDPKFIFNYNADNPNSFFRELEENLPPKSKLMVTTIYDNPFLGEEYISRIEAMETTNPREFNVRALGKWENLGDIVYFVQEKNILKELFTQSFPVISIGVDLGDNTAFVAVGFTQDYGRAVVLSEYYDDYESDKGTSDYVNDLGIFVQNIKTRFPNSYLTVYSEYATGGKQFIADVNNSALFRAMGTFIKHTEKGKLKERILFTDYLLREGFLLFHETPVIVEALKNAERDINAKGNNYYRLDRKKDNIHIIDAHDYAILPYYDFIGAKEKKW